MATEEEKAVPDLNLEGDEAARDAAKGGKITRLRRKVQVGSLVALNSAFLWELKGICVPVLNCHSCPIAVFACPIGVIGQFSSLHIFPFLAVGTLGLLGALVGRLLCGWVCPFGFLQELLHKIPKPKLRIAPAWRYCKYGVLAVLVILVPFLLTVESPIFFCRLCPTATLQSAIPWAIMRGGFPGFYPALVRMTVLAAVLLAAVANMRFFCKTLCPLGASVSLLNKVSGLRLRKKAQECSSCGICEETCLMQERRASDTDGANEASRAECVMCFHCMDSCPNGAIKVGM